ncbi:peptidoglycan amidohydrolase family protein [Anaerococcus vaginalis]|uniref:peptidoglycan amidohydrolase family protein n=1 Tax=Anaerococcus vaginalis TaxID=33037 RepID=UPI002902F6FE|nr:peptidoglycan amidohydrolase family protein [Anaerococcus vaginalis]MDU1030473.1 peptidoglycan amidohydrolase family protein [Anaerococcus vaginalis]
MNHKYKKFLLLNIFSLLFISGFICVKPSYADSDIDLKSESENFISTENNTEIIDSKSNDKEINSNFYNSDDNSEKKIEDNVNISNNDSSNIEKSNDNLDNPSSDNNLENNVNSSTNENKDNSTNLTDNTESTNKESSVKKTIMKSPAKKDGDFIWTEDGRCRYIYKDGSLPNVGFIEKNNNKYFTYGDGYIYTNQIITFGPRIMYFMGNDGRMMIGKFQDNYSKWRYTNDDGNLIDSKGWKTNNQGKHFAHDNGYLYTNQFITFGPEIMYFMGNDGRMIVGKFQDNSKKWRYTNDDGNLINSKGWKINNQGKHFAHGNGYLYTNQFITFGPEIMYFMGNDGRMIIGKFQDNSNRWRYTNDDGNLIDSKGWKTNNQGKHFAYGNGYLYTNQFITFGPKVMYFVGDDGLVKTSQFTYMKIATFHPDSNGLIIQGIQKIGNYFYNHTYSGISKGYKVLVNNNLYSFDNTGKGYLISTNYTPVRDLDLAIGWMYQAKDFNYEYSMDWKKRNQKGYADCSSAVYRALKHGGFISKNVANGNTETLFELGRRGQILKEISENEIRYGDIFVAGIPGKSSGSGGHTGFILDKNTIIHCNYPDRGISITERKGKMGDRRYPVKYYRLVGAI